MPHHLHAATTLIYIPTQREQATSLDQLHECLQNVDTTRTGQIESSKLQVVCQALGITGPGLHKVIKGCCKRGASAVNITEFLTALQKSEFPQIKELSRMNPTVTLPFLACCQAVGGSH